MTDSMRIPDLRLFANSRRNRSPTKDLIDFHNYKLTRYQEDFYPRTPIDLPLRPIDLPLRPIDLPPPMPLLSERIICQDPILYPRGFHEYIKAPSTYLDYAEGYLLGQPLPYQPLPTGRFQEIQIPLNTDRNTSRYHYQKPTKGGDCCCQQYHECSLSRKGNSPSRNPYISPGISSHGGGPNSNRRNSGERVPKKDPYLNIETQRSNNNGINIGRGETRKGQDEIKRGESKKEQRKQIKKNDEDIPKRGGDGREGNEREEVRSPSSRNHFLTMITENLSLFERENTEKKHQLSNQGTVNVQVIGPKKPQMVSEEVQVGENKSHVNRSSVLIQKMMKSIPSMLDEQAFRRLIKEHMETFNNIRVQFDDDFPIIDFEDLIETKDQYFELSRELQMRLDRLIGERNTAKRTGKGVMVWPDL